MTLELTIRRRGSLLSLVMERRITEAQAEAIRKLLEPEFTEIPVTITRTIDARDPIDEVETYRG